MSTDFLPFARPAIDQATIVAVNEVLGSGWITTGPKAAEFEARLSEFFGGRPVRVFANGTATMEIALRLCDIGAGDEVITTPITWAATANVIVAAGATPVFIDIDPHTRNINLDLLEAAITARTKAIMPVYLAGRPVDMDRLYALAQQYRLRVIEDAAQAIDSKWRGQRIGSFGDLVSFSFQANKNITCIEGGCLVMNNAAEAERAERLRLQGVVRSGMDGMDILEPGGKYNLSDVNAVIGLQQLRQVDHITQRRAQLAAEYQRCLLALDASSLGIELPVHDNASAVDAVNNTSDANKASGTESNWHMYQVVLPVAHLTGARAAIMSGLRAAGIGSGVHYPALHLFSYYQTRGWKAGDFPVAERIGQSILTLPLFPAMQNADVQRVCQHLVQLCKTLYR